MVIRSRFETLLANLPYFTRRCVVSLGYLTMVVFCAGSFLVKSVLLKSSCELQQEATV